MPVSGVNVTRTEILLPPWANSSNLNVSYVELCLHAHVNKTENTTLLEERSSIVVTTLTREKLGCWDGLAGLCRMLSCQLWLTWATKVSSSIQSSAFPKSAACSRSICAGRPGRNRHLSDEQT